MKKLILLSLLLFISSRSFSQVAIGFNTGLNSSTATINTIYEKAKDGSDSLRALAGRAKFGVHIGTFLKIKIKNWYIQPEFSLASCKSEIVLEDLKAGKNIYKNQCFTKVDIPVVIGYQLGPLRFGAGPIASYYLSSKSESEDQRANSYYTENFNKATFGYRLGVGLDIGRLTFDVSQEGNLSKLGDGVYVGGQFRQFDQRNKMSVFTLGYKLIKD